jgi:glycosyltransferase involved in cell wall biosynthesis
MLCPRYPPVFSGAGLQASRLARALGEKGVRSTILTTAADDTGRVEHRTPGVTVRRFRTPGSRRARDLILGVRAAGWLLSRSDWDLLHVHGFSSAVVLPLLAARLRRRPVLVKTTVLGGDDPESKRRGTLGALLLALYRRVDAVVALSAELHRIVERDPRMRGSAYLVPNGVDTELFSSANRSLKQTARLAFGLPAEAFVIVSTGAITARKDPACLIAAAARMRARPVYVVLAGPPGTDPRYHKWLNEPISRLPDGVFVTRLGSLPPDEVARLLQAADVFALASHREGFPNSVVEAMSTGVPCVVTDIPGSRDAVAEGGGCLVPVGDPQALSEVLDRLAADSAKRERLGSRGREIVEARFSFPVIAERYVAIYSDLLARDAR